MNDQFCENCSCERCTRLALVKENDRLRAALAESHDELRHVRRGATTVVPCIAVQGVRHEGDTATPLRTLSFKAALAPDNAWVVTVKLP
jgi:hypothetical protein